MAARRVWRQHGLLFDDAEHDGDGGLVKVGRLAGEQLDDRAAEAPHVAGVAGALQSITSGAIRPKDFKRWLYWRRSTYSMIIFGERDV